MNNGKFIKNNLIQTKDHFISKYTNENINPKSKATIITLKNGVVILYDMYRYSTYFIIYLKIINNDFNNFSNVGNVRLNNDVNEDEDSQLYIETLEIIDNYILSCYLSTSNNKKIY
jgi:hypothetical protein